ncbi:hypothetical protein [Mycetohabitans sp. B46]|uniref:hypothetical protein n=1 Tax=Mycetohabitans sp. B46 TaxID=2772536 RepID=UPI00307E2AAC
MHRGTETEDFLAFASWITLLSGQKAIVGIAAKYAALAGNCKVEFLDLSWLQIDETVASSGLSAQSSAAKSVKR